MTKIGIVCAMSEEVEKIITSFNLKSVDAHLPYNIFKNQQIVLIESSIGKVSSTLATSLLIERYSIDRLINIGLAGALKPITTGSAYFVNSVTQHDAFIPFVEYQNDMYQKINCLVPDNVDNSLTLTTGDQFIDNTNKVTNDADIVDMEGFAVAYVAKKYKLPITVIKGISDDANNSSKQELFKNLNMAMDQTIKLLKQVI